MPRKRVFIGLCLDKSGSMKNIWKSTIQGLNKQIKSILESGSDDEIETYVSFYVFDKTVHKVYQVKSVNHLTDVAEEDYEPKGDTAFVDCLNAMIDDLGNAAEEADPNNSYLVYTFSDGQETINKAGKPALKKRIEDKEGNGKWTFSFTGCDLNMEEIQAQYGFKGGNMMKFAKTGAGTLEAFGCASDSVKSYMRARKAGATQVDNLYTEDGKVKDLTNSGELPPDTSNLKTFKSSAGTSWKSENKEAGAK